VWQGSRSLEASGHVPALTVTWTGCFGIHERRTGPKTKRLNPESLGFGQALDQWLGNIRDTSPSLAFSSSPDLHSVAKSHENSGVLYLRFQVRRYPVCHRHAVRRGYADRIVDDENFFER
jgi:hypothetical protein